MILLRFFYLFSIYFLLIFCYSEAATASKPHPALPSTLKLSAESQLSVSADLFSLSLEVITEKQNAEKALTENNSKINAILKNLQTLGIDNDSIETSQFSISPIYSHPPKDENEEWVAEIKGYRVVNSIIVKTEEFNLAGKIIDAASQAGANKVGNIQFLLKNPRESHIRAIKTAIRNAMEDANALADSAGMSLKKIISVNLNPSPQPMFKTMMQYSSENNTPILQSNVDVKASVAVEFEIIKKQPLVALNNNKVKAQKQQASR